MLAVRRPVPAAADACRTASEHHLAIFVTVAKSSAVAARLPLPTTPSTSSTPAIRPSLAHQLAEELLHALRRHGLIARRLRDRYVATHGLVLRSWPIACRAPVSGQAGAIAVTVNFYEPRDGLSGSSATGLYRS